MSWLRRGSIRARAGPEEREGMPSYLPRINGKG